MTSRETDRPPEREIVLTPNAWAHICRRHPELAAFRDDILRAADAPRSPCVTTATRRAGGSIAPMQVRVGGLPLS